MTKYQEFLDNLGIICEEDFNSVIDSLPEEDISNIDFNYDDSCDDIANNIINQILSNWSYCYTEDVDFENKTFILQDVDSLEDLEEISKTFYKWTISNYEELVSIIKNTNDEEIEFDKLLIKIRNNATIEQLRNFANQL